MKDRPMKDRKVKFRIPILAAGGIVLRGGPLPRIAVVQSRKMETWGLPKGKLEAGEDALTAARREVLEETGCCVTVHEFLGALAYEANSRPKVVRFWRMEAVGDPAGRLMHDVKAVRWLALEDAIDQLTHPREQVFLQQVGPIALAFAESARRAAFQARGEDKNIAPGLSLAPAGDVFFPGSEAEQTAGPATQQPPDFTAGLLPAAAVFSPGFSDTAAQPDGTETGDLPATDETLVKKTLVRKTWGWFRHTALLQRQID
jgi:8-oxo-dGTP diphosphatase